MAQKWTWKGNMMSEKKTGLKPCPFCGSQAIVQEMKKSVTPRYYIACVNARDQCIASESYVFGKKYYSVSDAREAWNRRAGDQ